MPNRKTVGGLGAIQRPAVERFPPIFCTAAYPASIAASVAIPAVVAALAVAIPAVADALGASEELKRRLYHARLSSGGGVGSAGLSFFAACACWTGSYSVCSG